MIHLLITYFQATEHLKWLKIAYVSVTTSVLTIRI
jgi:hypothetical protein